MPEPDELFLPSIHAGGAAAKSEGLLLPMPYVLPPLAGLCVLELRLLLLLLLLPPPLLLLLLLLLLLMLMLR